MRYQSSLVILAVAFLVIGHALPSVNEEKIDEVDNKLETNDEKNFKPDPKIPKAMDPRFNKMLPKLSDNQLDTSTKAEKVTKGQKASTTEKAVKDETSTLGKKSFLISASSLKNFYFPAFVPFKDDKIENDMLKDVAHADVAKHEDAGDDADPTYDDYYDVSVACLEQRLNV